jgi:hypothetical protein
MRRAQPPVFELWGASKFRALEPMWLGRFA